MQCSWESMGNHCSNPCFVRSGGFWYLQKCPIWCQGNTGLGTFLNSLLRWIPSKVNLEKPYQYMLNAWALLMLPNLSKQVHTFLTSLPVLWTKVQLGMYETCEMFLLLTRKKNTEIVSLSSEDYQIKLDG